MKIKSITTYLQNGNSALEKIKIAYEFRDEDGHVLIEENYNEEQEIDQRIERIFDDQKRMVKELQFTYQETPDQTIVYHYDEAGKISQIQEHFSDGSITNKNFKRDLVNHAVTIELIDEENILEGREFRRFDTEGKLLEEEIFDEENLHHRIKIKYNDEGRTVERFVEDAEGYQETFFYKYEVNEEGRIGGVKISNKNKQLIRVEQVKYDQKGNQIEYFSRDLKQGWANMEKWEYDDQDRILIYQKIGGDGNVTEEIKNSYDEHGFLIQKETISGFGSMINLFDYEWYASNEEV